MNNSIFLFLYGLTHKSVFFDKFIVFSAVYLPYLVIFLAFVFLVFHHDILKSENPIKALFSKWKEFFLVFFSGALAWFFADILKYIFHTSRPFIALPNINPLFFESGYSFPSGHATFFMALAFAILFSHKKIGYVFVIIALIIGVARVVGGVHYPIDILGGFIFGIATAYLVRFLYRKVTQLN